MPLYEQMKKYGFTFQAGFLHVGFFIAAILVGIARYGRAFPAELTLLMSLWSIILFLHSFVAYRVESSPENADRKPETDVFKAVLISSGINMSMWVMWTLATDGLDASPWHLTMWLVLVTLVISGVIVGKQALYNHWLKTHIHNNPDRFEELKRKRHDVPETLRRLETDGEFSYEFEDADKRYSDRA